MNKEDFVFMKDGDKIMAGGYEVDSKLLQDGMPAIANIQKGGGLETLAVPAGLFLLQQHVKNGPNPFITTQESPSMISEVLYDRLLSLMTVGEKKKRQTRRSKSKISKSKKKRRTRRSR